MSRVCRLANIIAVISVAWPAMIKTVIDMDRVVIDDWQGGCQVSIAGCELTPRRQCAVIPIALLFQSPGQEHASRWPSYIPWFDESKDIKIIYHID